MAALVEGHQLGLSSLYSSSNSNKSAFHVKLTDSALRAIEEFQKIKDAVSPRKPKIQFIGNSGVIKVPIKKSSDNTEGYRTFHFGCSTIQGDPKGSFDCVKQQVSYGDGDELSSLGSMSHKVVVRASDDVFDDTKKKMTLAEEESKKQCAKEIKPGASGPYISKKIKKVVKREHLDLPLVQSSELSRAPMGSSTHSPNSHNKPIVSKPTSSHSGGHSSPVSSSFGSKSHHASSGRSRSSPHHPVKAPNPNIINLPFRDRIIHLLAVRPYKKPELLARLHKDGIRDKDKDSMSGILHNTAVFSARDNSYTLIKHLYDVVRDDWPGYTEVDKQLLKRRRPQEGGSANNSPVPSLSPAHSNCSQASSPTNSQKRPSSTSDLIDLVPLKKPRIAHERREKKPEQDRIDIGRSEIKIRSPDLKGRSPEVKASSPEFKTRSPDGKAMSPEGKARSPDSTTPPEGGQHKHRDRSLREHHNNNKMEVISQTEASSTSDTPPYVLKYKPIANREQRTRYKEIFNAEYEEYRKLHATVDHVTKRFKKLEGEIKAVKQGTEDYENVKNKIFNEYRTIKKDKKYIDQRKRCDYLHGKLGHIKRLILEFDQSVTVHS